MPTINDLLAMDDTPPFSERDFYRERAKLNDAFLMDYGIVTADAIDAFIRSGDINDASDLVERWLSLRAAERYLDLERPPKHYSSRATSAEQPTSRDSGSSYFRGLVVRVGVAWLYYAHRSECSRGTCRVPCVQPHRRGRRASTSAISRSSLSILALVDSAH